MVNASLADDVRISTEVAIDLPPGPWPYRTWEFGEVYRELRLPPPKPSTILYPRVYGRDKLPKADTDIKEVYTQKPLDLNVFGPCLLLPKNLVVRLGKEPSILPPTYFFGRRKLHAAIKRTSDDIDTYSLSSDIPSSARRHHGTVYYADSDHPKVYGHVLLDVIAKMWAYNLTPKGTPIATSVKMNRSYALMFSALGADPEKVVHIEQPVIPNSVYFPGIAFGRRDGAYPQAFEVFDKISSLKKMSNISQPEKVFLSRQKQKGRNLENEKEVESFFSSIGFAVVHPQDLPIEDQIALFSGAKMIAGAAGSAFHNAVFSPPETKILIICSTGWLHLADIFISRQEGSLGYVFGDPLTPPRDNHRTNGPWSVNIEDVQAAAKAHFDL